MKKKSLVVKIIIGIVITPIILFALLIGGIFGYSYYQDHFSTAAKLKKYTQTNNMEKLKKLKLNKGINGRYYNNTPLAYAVKANNVEAVKYFIEQGANVNLEILCPPYTSCAIPSENLLEYALFSNREIAKILIENGAKIDKGMIRSAAAREDKEIVELLKSAGAEHDIFSAIMIQDLPTIKTLIKNGVDINETIYIYYKQGVAIYGTTPLDLAEEVGNTEIIKLLKMSGARNSFFTAINRNDIKSVKEWIKDGININEKYGITNKRTPLEYIDEQIHNGNKELVNSEIIELLKSAGAKE